MKDSSRLIGSRTSRRVEAGGWTTEEAGREEKREKSGRRTRRVKGYKRKKGCSI